MTDPANYTLVGQATGKATIQYVQYDPATKTVLLAVSGVTADEYTLTVSDSIVSADRVALLTPHVTTFTAVSDISKYAQVAFTDTRSDRLDGTISYDVSVQNTSQFNLLVPLFLILDPAQSFTGVPQNANLAANGSWLISLSADRSRRRRASPGQSTTGVTITINNPSELEVAYTSEVSGTPPRISAPVFDSTPAASVTAGSVYTTRRRQRTPTARRPATCWPAGRPA